MEFWVLCYLMTPGLSKDIWWHVLPYIFLCLQIARLDLRPHVTWTVSPVITNGQLIFFCTHVATGSYWHWSASQVLLTVLKPEAFPDNGWTKSSGYFVGLLCLVILFALLVCIILLKLWLKLEALRERRPPWPRQIITPILPTVKTWSLGGERLARPHPHPQNKI